MPPAYAAELNPVEYLWARLQKPGVANLRPESLWALFKEARKALGRRRRKGQKLIQAFGVRAELD